MKNIFITCLLLSSITKLSASTCDASAAKVALKQATELNKDFKKCETFECAELASVAVQDKMCAASEACQRIAFQMYYPCDQRIVLTETDYQASGFMKKLIRRAEKEL